MKFGKPSTCTSQLVPTAFAWSNCVAWIGGDPLPPLIPFQLETLRATALGLSFTLGWGSTFTCNETQRQLERRLSWRTRPERFAPIPDKHTARWKEPRPEATTYNPDSVSRSGKISCARWVTDLTALRSRRTGGCRTGSAMTKAISSSCWVLLWPLASLLS
jgi:hypothetical protein